MLTPGVGIPPGRHSSRVSPPLCTIVHRAVKTLQSCATPPSRAIQAAKWLFLLTTSCAYFKVVCIGFPTSKCVPYTPWYTRPNGPKYLRYKAGTCVRKIIKEGLRGVRYLNRIPASVVGGCVWNIFVVLSQFFESCSEIIDIAHYPLLSGIFYLCL